MKLFFFLSFFLLLTTAECIGGGSSRGPGIVASSIVGESVLVDKETGRIFWEGGRGNTLDASVEPKLKALFRIEHSKSTLLTLILSLSVLRKIAAHGGLLAPTGQPRPFLLASCLCLLKWAILRLPDVSLWFIVVTAALYFVEAYCSGTRRYLTQACCSTEVEGYLEKLRATDPRIEWKVRSFHYEEPQWLSRMMNRTRTNSTTGAALNHHDTKPGYQRKRVSNVVAATFSFADCFDKTVAGVWKRRQRVDHSGGDESSSNTTTSNDINNDNNFCKITLSKLVVLSNGKTRDSYLDQQANFVAEHCEQDQLAEFATNIDIAGFRSRLLALREGSSIPTYFMRVSWFWFFTLLGLTVPYRFWFDSQCDEIRVTVQKEISADEFSSKRGWFRGVSDRNEASNGGFRNMMNELRLYGSPMPSKANTSKADITTTKNATTLVDEVDDDQDDKSNTSDDELSSGETNELSSGETNDIPEKVDNEVISPADEGSQSGTHISEATGPPETGSALRNMMAELGLRASSLSSKTSAAWATNEPNGLLASEEGDKDKIDSGTET